MDFLEVTRCWIWDFLIAMKIRCVHVPMCKSRVYIQPLLIFTMTPFANFVFTPHFPIPNFGKLLTALSCHFPFWHMSHMRRAGHPSDRTSVLDYSFTSDVTGMVTWNVRPYFLLQWNLSWVKNKCVLSSFMAVFVRAIWSLVIPRYEVLTAERGKLNQSQCWKRGASLLKEKCEDKEVFLIEFLHFVKTMRMVVLMAKPHARALLYEKIWWSRDRPSVRLHNRKTNIKSHTF